MGKIIVKPLTPSTDWYQPVTWKELVDAAKHLTSDEYEQGEVPWVAYRQYAIASIRESLDEWLYARSQEGFFRQIEGGKENGQFLDLIRTLTLEISQYSQTLEVLAWAVSQEEQIIKFKQKIKPYQFGSFLQKGLESKQRELEAYDEAWGLKKQVRALEATLLQEYQKYSLKTMAKLVLSVNSHKKTKNRQGSLKPVFRPVYTPSEFEHLCSEWMSYLGFTGISVSKASGDGGVDVFAKGAVAQVKFYNVPIGVAPIRELLGASVDYHAKPIFFCSMSYTQAAIDFAERNTVSLFVVDIFESTLKACSLEAINLLAV